MLAVIFNSRVQTMLFHWPVSYCFSEHTCRPSHTTQPRCAFGCTSRKTTDICLTAARGQMPAEFMRTRGSWTLPTCAANRNRPIALPGELVCGRLKRTNSSPGSAIGRLRLAAHVGSAREPRVRINSAGIWPRAAVRQISVVFNVFRLVHPKAHLGYVVCEGRQVCSEKQYDTAVANEKA